jgi:hypothetical protein
MGSYTARINIEWMPGILCYIEKRLSFKKDFSAKGTEPARYFESGTWRKYHFRKI